MRKSIVIFFLIGLVFISSHNFKVCRRGNDPQISVIKSKIPQLSLDQLPLTHEWNNVNNTNFLTLTKNQHVNNIKKNYKIQLKDSYILWFMLGIFFNFSNE